MSMPLTDEQKKVEAFDKETKALEKRMRELEDRIKERDESRMNSIAKGSSPMPVVGNRSNSDEQRALRYFGCRNAKDLLKVNTASARFRDVPLELKFLVQSLKNDIDVCRMTQQILHGEPLDRDERPSHVKGILNNNYGSAVLAPKLKAFDSTTPGAGDEWVPTAVSQQYIEEYELERRVAQLFRQVNMPTNPFDMPVQNAVTRARIQAEGGTLTGTNFGTAKIRLDAVKLTEFMPLTEELNEDSAPDILSLVRAEVVESEIRAVETAIINGDADGTHIDTDTQAGAADLAEKAWKGLRALALANSANGSVIDFSGAAPTTTLLRSMRQAMGKFGVNPRELAWIVSTKVYNQFLNLPEVTTVEKFGPMATILNGALAALDGIPIIISEFARDDLAATGVNTLPADALSSVILTNHRRSYFGVRRPIRVKAVMNPTPPNDEWLVAAWWRGDYQAHVQDATEVSISYGINII